MRAFKDGAVKKLTDGLAGMAKARRVEVVTGHRAGSPGPNTLDVDGTEVAFEHAIIAVGSQAVALPDMPDDPRIVDSTGALELPDVPERLLVIGGGIIGLEMATVHDALGSKVDRRGDARPADRAAPTRTSSSRCASGSRSATRRSTSSTQGRGDRGDRRRDRRHASAATRRPSTACSSRSAGGPNGGAIGADAAGVEVDERGFISVDEQMRTNVAHIFAIGDVVGEPMLAHKATHEAKVAAEVIAGENVAFDARAIPSVAYTDPEIAWMGLTETQAKEDGTEVETAVFPWAASGRALGMGRPEGMTKLVLEPGAKRLLGAGIVGVNAGELIAELVHALEMGADAEDIGLTIHPHPTLSESVGMAAEVGDGDDHRPPAQAQAAPAASLNRMAETPVWEPVVAYDRTFDARYGLEILEHDAEAGELRGRIAVRDELLTAHGARPRRRLRRRRGGDRLDRHRARGDGRRRRRDGALQRHDGPGRRPRGHDPRRSRAPCTAASGSGSGPSTRPDDDGRPLAHSRVTVAVRPLRRPA